MPRDGADRVTADNNRVELPGVRGSPPPAPRRTHVMTPPRRRADPSPSPSSPPPLLSRLRSAASSFLARQYSTKKGGDGTGPPKPKGGGSSAPRHLRPGFVDPSSWRHFDSRAVGINPGAIHSDAWSVLRKLRREGPVCTALAPENLGAGAVGTSKERMQYSRQKFITGFEAYLVGGCVRDLLLKRVPKDFDVITTASLQQLKKNIFRRCIIVGKRFPICLLKMRDSAIEISSFRTVAKYGDRSEKVDHVEELNCSDDKDILRWKDSMRRDFTINGLFFNPMNYKIYDYVNGVRDMRKNKVCTVIPAHISFMEDPARILRGFRIAGRLGFQFSSETSNAIRDLSSSIISIDKARLLMEMNYIMSYGAAAPSVRLLRKYGLLDILLPFQAAYLSDQMKVGSSDRDLMLMKLLVNLDRLLSADRPCHSSLWLALLVFHSTLVISPQDTLVIRAFAAVLYFGTWETTVKFLEKEVGPEVPFAPETTGPSQTKLDDLMEQTSHLASLVNSSVDTLTCLHGLEQSLARFSEPPQFSGAVLASNNDRKRLSVIFEGLASDLPSYDERRGMRGIDYWSLKHGDPAEIRFVLGKVIMDTMYNKLPCESTEDEDTAAAVEPAADLADGRSLPPLSALF